VAGKTFQSRDIASNEAHLALSLVQKM